MIFKNNYRIYNYFLLNKMEKLKENYTHFFDICRKYIILVKKNGDLEFVSKSDKEHLHITWINASVRKEIIFIITLPSKKEHVSYFLTDIKRFKPHLLKDLGKKAKKGCKALVIFIIKNGLYRKNPINTLKDITFRL